MKVVCGRLVCAAFTP
ncbi:hypothetical protein M2F96_22195 [Vibrio vulnificus]|nr:MULTISPECIES: hypothetical protein [Vibrio]MCU8212595.1 hypothetical protein [Vibrio vulnificus]MCU8234376.1 hypothetical protein [Vibrio vulnificus]MCU8295724.1 hypothetical protein [Vibrio vulnificus]MCU8374100.1 hypothetical protein [Vibrio vulnificus]MCU8523399.1 hypothetical protein [Vibrio vulnificus]